LFRKRRKKRKREGKEVRRGRSALQGGSWREEGEKEEEEGTLHCVTLWNASLEVRLSRSALEQAQA